MKRKRMVLFLCTHNAARSQMAEVLLRHLAGDRFEVASAGLAPTVVHPLTRQVLTEAGLDAGGLRAKGVGEFLSQASVRLSGPAPVVRQAHGLEALGVYVYGDLRGRAR